MCKRMGISNVSKPGIAPTLVSGGTFAEPEGIERKFVICAHEGEAPRECELVHIGTEEDDDLRGALNFALCLVFLDW